MHGVEHRRGLPLPQLATVFILAAAIGACCVAWFELRDVSTSPASSPTPLDPYEHLRSIDEIVENEPDAVARLVRLLTDADPRTRCDALVGLSRLAGEASGALEAVRARLSDGAPEVRDQALAAFARVCPIRDESYSVAAQHLADPVPAIRGTASRILREAGADAIPALVETLRSPSAAVRSLAAQLIEFVDPDCDDSRSTEALHGLIADPDPVVRQQGIDAIVKRRMAEVGEIREWLLAEDSRTIESGISSIDCLGPERDELLPVLLQRIEKPPSVWSLGRSESGKPLTRDSAERQYWRLLIAVLATFKTAARPAAEVILRQVAEMDEADQLVATHALLEIGAEPEQIMPIIRLMIAAGGRKRDWARLLTRASPTEARRRAHEILDRSQDAKAIGDPELDLLFGYAPAAPEAVSVLKQLLKGSDHRQGRVLYMLRDLGPLAASAVPELVAVVGRETSDPGVVAIAIDALGRIGPAARDAVPVLLGIMNAGGLASNSPHSLSKADLRDDVSRALGQIGDGSPEVLAALRRQLALHAAPDNAHSVNFSRVAALHALIALDAATDEMLLEALGDEFRSMRVEAVLALPRPRGDRHRAIEMLIHALDDADPYVQSAATLGLRELGADAEPAVPKLRYLAEHGSQVASGYQIRRRDAVTGAPIVFYSDGRGNDLAQISVARAARWVLATIDSSE